MTRNFIIGNSSELEDKWSRLARLAQTGDSASYRLLLEDLTTYFRALIRRRLGSVVEVDDLVQECLLGIHKNLKSYQPNKPFKPWTHAILRYKVADYFRLLAKREETAFDEQDPLVTKQTTGANNDEGESDRLQLLAAIESLPEALQRSFKMIKVEGLSYEEAASSEGVSPAAVRKRVSRAYQALRDFVEKDWEPKDAR